MSRSSAAESSAAVRPGLKWSELVERFPIRREALLVGSAVLSSIIFYFTSLQPPGILVYLNYAFGSAGSLIVGYFLSHLIPVGAKGKWGLAIAFAAAMVVMWAQYDHFQDRWINDSGDRYSDWTHRWSGKVTHRTLRLKNHWQSAMVGPMSGEPERPHGRWQEVHSRTKQSSDAWFWYGKRISQGEWESRNRRM